MSLPLLSSLIFVPFLAAWCVLLFRKSQIDLVKKMTTLLTAFVLVLATYLVIKFNPAQAGFQFTEKYYWIAPWNVRYFIGVDGLSLFFIWLSALVFLLASLKTPYTRARERKFYFALLLLEAATLGSFLALDLFLFYMCWALLPVPMYFLIGIWGSHRRDYAAIKYFLYAFSGGLLLLLGILALYFSFLPHTFDWTDLAKVAFHPQFQKTLFLAFFISFAVSIPVFPVHTWLPDAQVEAATPASIFLAGILLKIGAYAFLRFNYSLFPDAAIWFRPTLAILAVISIVYGGLVTLGQTDFKKMLAYSSMSQMGLVLFGFAAKNLNGMNGAVLQMLHHGLVITGLLLLAAMLYSRTGSRDMRTFGGLGEEMPVFTRLLIFFCLALAGLPGLSGFTSLYRILLGGYTEHCTFTALAAFGIFLTTCYLFVLIYRVLKKPAVQRENRLEDLNFGELSLLVPLMILIVVLGVYPDWVLNYTAPAVQAILAKTGGLT